MNRIRLVAALLALLVAIVCIVGATSNRPHAGESLHTSGHF